MREITQALAGNLLMADRSGGPDHRSREEVITMQTLRATAIVLPFIALAVLVEILSLVVAGTP